MPVDDELMLLNLKIDSADPNEAKTGAELDNCMALLDKANDEICDYMKQKMKGSKVKDVETTDFIGHLLKKMGDQHVKIVLKRHEVDKSPYYASPLIINNDEIVNNYPLKTVSGKPLFPKEIFSEFARLWIAEDEPLDETFAEKVATIREKFTVEGETDAYTALPYPKQVVVVAMLYANKIYNKISPDNVNFLCEWIKRKLNQLGHKETDAGVDAYEALAGTF